MCGSSQGCSNRSQMSTLLQVIKRPSDPILEPICRLLLGRPGLSELPLVDPLSALGKAGGYVLVPGGDGCVRFVLDVNLARDGLSALYHPYTVRGRVAATVLNAAGSGIIARYLPFWRLAFSGPQEAAVLRHLRDVAGIENSAGICFQTGTPGPERKPCGVIIAHDGTPKAFVKAAPDGVAADLVTNEARVLALLSEKAINTCIAIPRVLHSGTFCGLSITVTSALRLPFGLVPRPLPPRPLLAFLVDLAETFGKDANFATTTTRKNIAFWALEATVPQPWQDLLRVTLSYLDCRLKQVRTTLLHGDFAPFNVLCDHPRFGTTFGVIDWERASLNELAGMDLCHWFVAPRLLAGVAPARVADLCLNTLEKPDAADILFGVHPRELLLAYLASFGGRAAAKGMRGRYVTGCFKMLKFLLDRIARFPKGI